MDRFPLVLLLTVLVAGPGSSELRAQASPPTGLDVEMSLRGTVFDNLFRVSNEADQRQIGALQVSGSLIAPLDSAGRTELSLEGTVIEYEDLGTSPGVAGTLRAAGRSHAFFATVGYQWSRPSFEAGDVLETADIARGLARYTFRPGTTVEFGTFGLVQRLAFEGSPQNDGTLARVEGSVRYRGFGYRFAPEVGAGYGTRSTESGAQDFREQDLFARITAVPVGRLWTSLRYRYRTRDYEIEDPTSPSFGREDRHAQWTASAAIDVTPRTKLDIYYDYLDGDSDLSTRVFTSQLLTVGLTWRY